MVERVTRINHWTDPRPSGVGVGTTALINKGYRWCWTEAHQTPTFDSGTVLVTCNTDSESNPNIVRANNWGADGGLLTPGSWVLSAKVSMSEGLPVPSIVIWFSNSAGTAVGSSIVIGGAQTGERVSWSITAPAGTAHVSIMLRKPTGGATVGEWYRVSETLLSPSSGAYFSGATPQSSTSAGVTRYKWEGAADLSRSIETYEHAIPNPTSYARLTNTDLEISWLKRELTALGQSVQGLTYQDLRRRLFNWDELAYWASRSGLSLGTLVDHKLAAMRNDLGVTTGTLADVSRMYWARNSL